MTRKFDKEKFACLLAEAMGDRSINQYALHSGVSATYISRLLRNMVNKPPMPPTIEKLASKAYDGVNYTALMQAAGHYKTGDIAKHTVPVLGSIQTGLPLLVDDNYEGELEIPADIAANFALRIKGDSMIGVGLHEGDYAICREAQTAGPGQIVVALSDISTGFTEATLKYYFEEKDGPVLRAANPNYKDIPLNEEHRIGGVIVSVLKKDPPSYKIYNRYLAARDINKERWDPVIERAFQLGIKPEQIKEMLEMVWQVSQI